MKIKENWMEKESARKNNYFEYVNWKSSKEFVLLLRPSLFFPLAFEEKLMFVFYYISIITLFHDFFWASLLVYSLRKAWQLSPGKTAEYVITVAIVPAESQFYATGWNWKWICIQVTVEHACNFILLSINFN